VLIEIIGSSFL
jgi:hypothetical protein